MNRDFTIRDILWMIRRAIIPIAAIVIGVILVCALLLPSDGEAAVVYRTTADFQISADESSADPVASAIAVIPTYISVLESDGFSGRIADAAGISDSDAVTDSISFEQIVNTSVLRVSISADSPEQCIAIANACADVIATDAASIVGFGTVAPLGASEPAEHSASAGLGKGTTIAIAALAALLCAAAVFIAIGIANPIIDLPEDAVLLYD
ncbi:MAG: hypothetical protein IJP17_00605, partial [Clostridia bacterium]|nr:hypothetical protein [Clostridia bacterium]